MARMAYLAVPPVAAAYGINWENSPVSKIKYW